jgi:hypothetical protein
MARRSMRMPDEIKHPPSRITLGISGHREGNAAFASNRAGILDALATVFDIVDRVTARHDAAVATTRLISPLAQGADMVAAAMAIDRHWNLIAPIPFGLDLNIAINACPDDAVQTLNLLEGQACAAATQQMVDTMRAVAASACRLELAEQDEHLRALFIHALRHPEDSVTAQQFAALSSDRAAAAARMVIEQSDLLIAIWDGRTPGAVGGTRHTMATALALGLPVLWIDAAAPANWSLLRLPEDLAASPQARMIATPEAIDALLEDMIVSARHLNAYGVAALRNEAAGARGLRCLPAYRWVEHGFAGKDQAAPVTAREAVAAPRSVPATSDVPLVAAMRALPGLAPEFVERVEHGVMARFGWVDAVSTALADAYRGGMVLNFILSALAIVGGLAYLPITDAVIKWPFALFEFLLLIAIVGITMLGGRKHWHSRWFQTRRVAEYLRHAPVLVLLGIGRPPGRWPRGKDSAWPEAYVRDVLGDIGLPALIMTQGYLRTVVRDILLRHVVDQAAYHRAKAGRLAHIHHNLDMVSETSFKLAVLSVAFYLLIAFADMFHLLPFELSHTSSKIFTFLGVLFPTVGGAVAGIRYFGDFERFAAISDVTAEKLDTVRHRIDTLLSDKAATLRFAHVAELATAVDDIVIGEIENWQAVFATKTITVPV